MMDLSTNVELTIIYSLVKVPGTKATVSKSKTIKRRERHVVITTRVWGDNRKMSDMWRNAYGCIQCRKIYVKNRTNVGRCGETEKNNPTVNAREALTRCKPTNPSVPSYGLVCTAGRYKYQLLNCGDIFLEPFACIASLAIIRSLLAGLLLSKLDATI